MLFPPRIYRKLWNASRVNTRVAARCGPLLTGMLLCAVVAYGAVPADARLEEAAALARAGDYAPAWCIWQALSEAGNAEAKFHLGWLYRNGQGVAVDEERARTLWEAAAAQDHGEAQMALATLYAFEGSTVHDPARAVQWYAAAAAQGFEDALLILFSDADAGDSAAADAVAALARDGRVGKPARVTVDKANVRARPSTRAEVLATLPPDTRVYRLQVREPWWRVWVPDREILGWMHRSLFR
jgi:hypothetical protein